MKTIESLSSKKENEPSRGNITVLGPWKYCYSCGANRSHDSTHCTSKYKYAAHKDDATFKDTKGGSTKNFRVPAVRRKLQKSS